MNAEQLKRLIEQERANEQNALIAVGVAIGKRQAYEAMLADLQMRAAVEQAKAKEGDETKA